MHTTVVHVSGMTCDHCVRAVSDELSALAGVEDVRVVLVPGGTSDVSVDTSGPVSMEEIHAAILEAGYDVVD